MTGSSPGACGLGGGSCMVCEPSFVCTSGGCTVDPASRWNLFVDRITVQSTYHTGVAWDLGGGLPDPYVGVAVGTSGPYSYTPEPTGTDTLSATYSGPAVLTNLRADTLLALAFEAWDDDGIGDDDVGACSRPVPSAAFTESVQTTVCPRDPAAAQSGFSIDWHLERF